VTDARDAKFVKAESEEQAKELALDDPDCWYDKARSLTDTEYSVSEIKEIDEPTYREEVEDDWEDDDEVISFLSDPDVPIETKLRVKKAFLSDPHEPIEMKLRIEEAFRSESQ